jgi:hypothetical protein
MISLSIVFQDVVAVMLSALLSLWKTPISRERASSSTTLFG